MSFVQARTVAGGVPINGTGSARLKLAQQSAARAPGSVNYNQDAFLLEHG
jgi:hypothetical protein